MWGLPINYSRFFPQVICRASGFLSCEFPGSRAFHETAAMPKRRHSNEKDELLMAEVKKYPFLYDKNHGSYSNQNKRKAVWEEIAAVVGISGTDSKLRWSNIRDCFMRCLKQKAQKERATGTQTHRFHYKYADQLEWLIPYINLGEASSTTGDEDQQFADNDLDGEGEEEDGFLPTQVPTATTVSHPQVKRRKQQEPDESTMQFVVTHDSAPREDGLDTFFKSICWNVRKLPPITQAQLRFQITELVFKAEMSHLTNDCDVKEVEDGNGEEVKAKKKAEPQQVAEPKEEVYTTGRKSESGKSYNLKISAWNIGGMKAWIKKGGIDYIKKESPDIFFAQETKVDASKPPPEAALADYHITYNEAEKKGYSGVALFSKKKPLSVTKGIGIEKHDKEGRLITAEYDSFYFVGVYIPNSSRGLVRLDYRQEWDKDFLAYLKKLDAKKPVICCGDMNVAHEEIDLKNPKSNRNKTPGFTDQEREGFTNLLNAGFVDSFRHLYPDKEMAYSFWTYMGNCRAKNVGWRLDYGVISKSLLPKLCDNQMRTQTFGSDHCPMVIYMAI